ncbi:hypothetical protein [Sulfurimonas sp.]|uniref:hypothetical protein n=1 Tax=Sulfurimonas sp. TaxID=2022749 RepID=UPI0025D09CA1|nr:hypothetical protein [Sulfurimonas sp.]
MKTVSQQIYDFLTNETFKIIDPKLKDSIEKLDLMAFERNEFTAEELIKVLPEIVDILISNIEDDTFDSLPFAVRSNIFTLITDINNTLLQLYQGNNQLPVMMERCDQLRSIFLSTRLDFRTKKIPLFDKKIKQYDELTIRLSLLIEQLEHTEERQKLYNSLVESITKTEAELVNIETKAEAVLKAVSDTNGEVVGFHAETSSTLKEIKALLTIATDDSSVIDTIKIKSAAFIAKVDQYIENMTDTDLKIEKLLKKVTDETTAIIEKNQNQSVEIDNQLGKAVGVSLFKSFQTRRKSLSRGLNKWLTALGWSTAAFLAVSVWIFYDVSHVPFNPFFFALKVAISFPLLFVIGFVASRYTKERRLIEEYAFKASVALALKPYADLIENDKSDEKYREFLIKTIENIFAAPTDKVFASEKKTVVKNEIPDMKNLDSVLDMIKKIKDLQDDK